MHKKAKKGVGQSKNFGKYRLIALPVGPESLEKLKLAQVGIVLGSFSLESSQPSFGWDRTSNDFEA